MADKRLAIFVFYDPQGIIDDYVTYYLSKIKEVVQHCIFVSQGALSTDQFDKIRDVADEIIQRANEGYDAGAIKQIIVDHGKDYLDDYDELLITNDSVYGPFYPLSDCFHKMSGYDFWGMTKNPGAGSIPEHLQSFFMVVGERMLHSREFYDYWDTMPYYKDFNDLLDNYEFSFTKKFESLGYSWKEYVGLDDYLRMPTKYTINPYYQLLDEAVRVGKFPFLKRKPFSYSDNFLSLDRFSRQSFFKAIQYV
jgi:rhamnosyltransferase